MKEKESLNETIDQLKRKYQSLEKINNKLKEEILKGAFSGVDFTLDSQRSR